MRRKLFLITLSLLTIFSQGSQILASSDLAEDISLLTGQRKIQTHPLTGSYEKSDVVLGPNIVKYMNYCSKYEIKCDLAEALWYLVQFKHKIKSFRMTAQWDFKIPEQFIQGIFDDLQNPERVLAIKALIRQSNQREEKEAEEAKAVKVFDKQAVMDISSLSSNDFLEDGSLAVSDTVTHQLTASSAESCATTHDSQLRQRKVAQPTSPTIPSH